MATAVHAFDGLLPSPRPFYENELGRANSRGGPKRTAAFITVKASDVQRECSNVGILPIEPRTSRSTAGPKFLDSFSNYRKAGAASLPISRQIGAIANEKPHALLLFFHSIILYSTFNLGMQYARRLQCFAKNLWQEKQRGGRFNASSFILHPA